MGVGVQLLKCAIVGMCNFQVGCSWKYGLGCVSGCGHVGLRGFAMFMV